MSAHRAPAHAGAHAHPARPRFRAQFSNGVVATLRSSGTEPKLKWYAEASGSDDATARAEVRRTVQLILDDMLRPELHGLTRPAIA